MTRTQQNLAPGGQLCIVAAMDKPGGFQTAGGHESEGKQPLGKESPDDPLAGNREALRRPIHKPERQPETASIQSGAHRRSQP